MQLFLHGGDVSNRFARLVLGWMCLVSALVSAQTALAQTVPQLWASANCLMCHGDRGQGGMAPSLLDRPWPGPEEDLRYFQAIRNGQEEDGMPAYAGVLGDDAIWGLVVYIRELQAAHLRQGQSPQPPRGQSSVRDTSMPFAVEAVVDSGITIPWALAEMPDGAILIAERPGTLRLWREGQLGEPIQDTPEVAHAGQGGLLGIALHPAYEDNGWVYLSYTHALDGGLMTRVVRGVIEDGRWQREQVVYEAPPQFYHRARLHFGCRLVFDDQGYLYIAIGDRGRSQDAQNLATPFGKVHRLHDDGRVPADNPFVDDSDALATIWSYGHRNPQGMVFDASDGTLWLTEHGPRGGDELNRVQRGGNYGWPEVTHGIHYNGRAWSTPWHDGQFVDPVYHWTPSIAACGLAVVRGEAFASWQGDLLAGGLAGQVLERVRVADTGEVTQEVLLRGQGRVRDVIVAHDGTIYVALNTPDRIIRLVPLTQAGAAGEVQP